MASVAVSKPLGTRRRIGRQRQELWLGLMGLVVAGLLLGTSITGSETQAWSGTTLIALGALAAIFRPSAGMAVFAFSLPLGLVVNIGPLEINASAAIIASVGLSWIARAVKDGSWRWSAKRLDAAVALFAAATVLSLAVTSGFGHGQLVALLVALTAFLVFFLTSRTVEASIDLWLIVGALILSSLIQATGTAFKVLAGNLVVSEDTRVFSDDLADPNHFAGILLVVCLLVIAIGISFPKLWPRVAAILAALVFSAVLLATLSRSGWLGLLGGVVLLFFLLPERRPQLVAIAGVVAVVLLAAGLGSPVIARLSPHATGPLEMLASRWRVWTAALAMTADHPIFGVGLGNFGAYYPFYSVRPIAVDHAHNLFLNILAERGIFAVLTFINVVVAYFLTVGIVLRHANSEPLRVFSAGLIASFGGYLVHSLFDVSYYDTQVLFLVWILIGLGAALPKLTRAAIPDPRPSFSPVPVSRELPA